MRHAWIGLLPLISAACIGTTALVPCGDVVCPRDQVCFADSARDHGQRGVCVDVEMVDACADHGPGESCTVATVQGFDGVCRDGVCQIPTCGDGFARDPEPCEGEDLRGVTCEDLGRYPGVLACTSLCTFDRSGCGGYCGDGVREAGTEPCEGADLAAATCADFGRYRGTLACNQHCQLDSSGCVGRCGDGTIDSGNGEVCEGSDVGLATCRTVGRYRGTLTCGGACQLDLSGCSGSCGDGVIDVAEGEACDGIAPQGTCISFGFDIGRLGCAGCQRSFTSCGRFGYDLRAEVSTQAAVAEGYSNGLITALNTGAVLLIDHGVASVESLGVSEIGVAGHDGVIVAMSKTRTRRYRNTIWETLPSLESQATGWVDYVFADDFDAAGNIYAVTLSCQVYVFLAATMSWMLVPSPPGGPANCRLIRGLAPDNIWVGGVHWDGATWDIQGYPTSDMVIRGTTVYAATDRGIERVTRTTNDLLFPGTFSRVETFGGGICGVGTTLQCLIGGLLRDLPAPGSVLHGDGQTLSFFDSSRLVTSDVGQFEEFASAAGAIGAVVVSGDDDATAVLRYDSVTGTSSLEIDPGTATRITTNVQDVFVGLASFHDGWIAINQNETLFLVGRLGTVDYAPITTQTYVNDYPVALWGDGAGFVAALYSQGSVSFYDLVSTGNSSDPLTLTAQDITTLPVPATMTCTPNQITGRSRADLFVLSLCVINGQPENYDVVFRFDGAAWTLWYTASAVGAGDSVFAIPGDDRLLVVHAYGGAGQRIEWVRNGVKIDEQIGNFAARVTGSSAVDLFGYGSVDAANRPLLNRWDGVAWTPVKLPATTTTMAAATTPTMLTLVGTERTLRLMRMRTTP